MYTEIKEGSGSGNINNNTTSSISSTSTSSDRQYESGMMTGIGSDGSTATGYKSRGESLEEFSYSMIPKIVAFVGFGFVIAGLIIMLAGLSAVVTQQGYLDVICAFAPLVVLGLSFVNRMRLTANHIAVVLLCSVVSALISFFNLIVYAKMAPASDKNAVNSAASGSFFIFLGEATVFASTILMIIGF